MRFSQPYSHFDQFSNLSLVAANSSSFAARSTSFRFTLNEHLRSPLSVSMSVTVGTAWRAPRTAVTQLPQCIPGNLRLTSCTPSPSKVDVLVVEFASAPPSPSPPPSAGGWHPTAKSIASATKIPAARFIGFLRVSKSCVVNESDLPPSPRHRAIAARYGLTSGLNCMTAGAHRRSL